MRYEVYVDVLFVNCLVMNYWILSLTGIFLGRSATRRRKVMSAAFGVLPVLFRLLVPGIPAPFYAALGYGAAQILILWLAFRIKTLQELFYGCICMYLLTFLFGGCVSFLQAKTAWFRGGGFLMPTLAGVGAFVYGLIRALTGRIRRNARIRRVESSRYYEVHFRIGDKQIDCIGLLDTGNGLYEPIRGVPVAVLEESLFPPEKREMPRAVIPYHSLGCRGGILYGYEAQEITLIPIARQEKETVYLAEMLVGLYEGRLSAKNDYQILLHPDFFFTETKNEAEKRGNNHDIESGNTGETADAPSA